MSSCTDSDSAESPLIEEGLESPIDNFVFRQCPAEFKLKIFKEDETPNWSKGLKPPKASLLQISHSKGIIIFPHHEKGQLAYSPINKLAEKEEIHFETLEFPEDESQILSMSLNTSENNLFVSKASKKIYAIDLATEVLGKRPFISGTSKTLESPVIHCHFSDDEMWVILKNGDLMFFNLNADDFLNQEELIKFQDKFGCMSPIRDGILALGSKEAPKLYFVDLNEEELDFQSIDVPFEDLNSGSKGISSINLIPNAEGVLFSCVPDNPESDDVPLLLLENIYNGNEFKFSTFFDPCASRPPRENQFYYLNSPFSCDNLCDFVVLGNFASPDIGICGRLALNDTFQTFYIDNDEGLAQLPFVDGEMIYTVGLALDLSSKTTLDNSSNPDAKAFPPAPILWILTNSGHLCPFSMLKTDETEPFGFMKTVPVIGSFSEVAGGDSITSGINAAASIVISASAPQTPSKVPLEQLASLQKSTEIKPASPSGLFSFKPAPVEKKQPETTVKPLALSSEIVKPLVLSSESVKPVVLSSGPTNPVVLSSEAIKPIAPTKPKTALVEQLAEPELVKKEEIMVSINEGAYKNILLSEIAAAHATMQDDLFILKQLTMKNSLLLRQNCQKYFNSLESLESYAGSLEKLVSSSDKVFLGIKDKLDGLKFDLKDLMGKTRQVKSTWNRIKQDNKIDWDARVQTLNTASRDLIERIDRVKSFTSNPSEALKYQATLKSFVDSTQEKIQSLMSHLSGLFVSQSEDVSSAVFTDFGSLSLSPSLSGDILLDQLKVLSLEGSIESVNPHSRIENRNKSLLNAVKSRGARLSVPNKVSSAVSSGVDVHKLKLSAEDESLISSFISSIKLTENVPEFADIAGIAKLSLNDEPVETKVTEPKAAPFAFKPADPNPEEPKSAFTEVKPVFSFKPAETKPAEPKSFIEAKPTFSFKPEEPKSAFTEPKSTFSFKPAEIKPVEPKSISTESKPTFSSKPAETKPVEPKSASIESKPAFSFKPAEAKPTFDFKSTESKSDFSFKSSAVTSEESKPAPTESKPRFDFKPTDSRPTFDFKSTAFEFKPAEPKPAAFEFKSEDKPAAFEFKPIETETVAASKETESVPKPETIETPKIPSIFTVSRSKPDDESVLKKESPLPTFDSLSFDGEDNAVSSSEFKTEPPAVKPFPSIFGVKPSESAKPVEPETTHTPCTTSTTTATNSSGGFGFNFKPQIPVSAPESNTVTAVTKSVPSPSTFVHTSKFAPPSQPQSSFSITNKPTFSFSTAPAATSSPVFGAPSMPKPSAASFGLHSLPSLTTSIGFGGQMNFPSSTSNLGTSGFAAFASASQNNSTFSSFSNANNPNSQPSTSLTFASFLPSEKDKKQNSPTNNSTNTGNNNSSSTFSFTGFRE